MTCILATVLLHARKILNILLSMDDKFFLKWYFYQTSSDITKLSCITGDNWINTNYSTLHWYWELEMKGVLIIIWQFSIRQCFEWEIIKHYNLIERRKCQFVFKSGSKECLEKALLEVYWKCRVDTNRI